VTNAQPVKTRRAAGKPKGWLLLVYKLPSEPSRIRVGIWRELKRLGALYLQQAVAVLPNRPEVAQELPLIRERIDAVGGTGHYFEIPRMTDEREEELVRGFQALAAREYAEIVEECETKFMKEIEFERFRQNYTFEEAEEIRQDLEKIKRWFGRVVDRDWFGAEGRADVESWLTRCESELETFEDEVFEMTGGGTDAGP
jgi:hypothetical protein